VIGPGLYEQLLTEALRSELDLLDGRFNTSSRSLHTAEAADRIALHLSRRIQRTLASVGDSDRVQVGIEVARDLIARLAKIVEAELAEAPVEPGTVLHAVLQRRPDGTTQPIAEPLIPLLDTTLSATRCLPGSSRCRTVWICSGHTPRCVPNWPNC